MAGVVVYLRESLAEWTKEDEDELDSRSGSIDWAKYIGSNNSISAASQRDGRSIFGGVKPANPALIRQISPTFPRLKYDRELIPKLWTHVSTPKCNVVNLLEFVTTFMQSPMYKLNPKRIKLVTIEIFPIKSIEYILSIFGSKISNVVAYNTVSAKAANGCPIECRWMSRRELISLEDCARFREPGKYLLIAINRCSISDGKVEDAIVADLAYQTKVYGAALPDAYLSRFHLPWLPGSVRYLDGEIRPQAFIKPTLTTSMMYSTGRSQIITYDQKKYEEQMFYFNVNLRNLMYVPCRKFRIKMIYDDAVLARALVNALECVGISSSPDGIIARMSRIGDEVFEHRNVKCVRVIDGKSLPPPIAIPGKHPRLSRQVSPPKPHSPVRQGGYVISPGVADSSKDWRTKPAMRRRDDLSPLVELVTQ